MLEDWFGDRTGVIATKHRKEEVIAPILTQALGIQTIVPTNFDTDQWGTFTREVQRPGDQRFTARLKAEHALQLTGETLAIASEGSFGPHPAFPYIASNREIVLLLDQAHHLEIVGEDISTETNYRQQLICNLAEAEAFAQKVGFPDHGLIVRSDLATPTASEIFKGITTPADLEAAVTQSLARSPTGKIQIETDMRALYNPTRMQAIARATHNLIQKLNQTCPCCGYPGFDICDRKRGLRCALCNRPTSLIASVVYQCQHCQHQKDVPYPDGIQTADPAQCAYCNP